MKKNKLFAVGLLAMALTLGLVLAGCDNGTPGGGGGSNFVPVTDITDILVIALVNKELTLSGTVKPANATNKTITWSGDNVTDGVFKATTAGTSEVTATIANGASESSPYTKTFTINAYTTDTESEPDTEPDTDTVAKAIDDAQGTWRKTLEGYTLEMEIADMNWTMSAITSEGTIPVCRGILIDVGETTLTYKTQQYEEYNGSNWYAHPSYEEGTYTLSEDKKTLTLTADPKYSDSKATGTWTKQPE